MNEVIEFSKWLADQGYIVYAGKCTDQYYICLEGDYKLLYTLEDAYKLFEERLDN